eukprot:TRINITY_DN12538_c0_g2_i1.p1 TRINITY_DN12538_c0_g2~~TRINITY_DN12538_c0_g2_i1.p1  ORF type:complete len:402 (+),score=-43.21 TRINITY_DN12538_c0_g2_i1:1493-2698(+)
MQQAPLPCNSRQILPKKTMAANTNKNIFQELCRRKLRMGVQATKYNLKDIPCYAIQFYSEQICILIIKLHHNLPKFLIQIELKPVLIKILYNHYIYFLQLGKYQQYHLSNPNLFQLRTWRAIWHKILYDQQKKLILQNNSTTHVIIVLKPTYKIKSFQQLIYQLINITLSEKKIIYITMQSYSNLLSTSKEINQLSLINQKQLQIICLIVLTPQNQKIPLFCLYLNIQTSVQQQIQKTKKKKQSLFQTLLSNTNRKIYRHIILHTYQLLTAINQPQQLKQQVKVVRSQLRQENYTYIFKLNYCYCYQLNIHLKTLSKTILKLCPRHRQNKYQNTRIRTLSQKFQISSFQQCFIVEIPRFSTNVLTTIFLKKIITKTTINQPSQQNNQHGKYQYHQFLAILR